MKKRKIFMIGNGFDISFKQPTRYDDLMNDIYNSVKNNNDIPITKSHSEFDTSIYVKEVIYGHLESKFIRIDMRAKGKFICTLSSIMFKELIEHYDENKNWGNIEKGFFDCLNNCKNAAEIDVLNEELDHLKNLPIIYLNKIEQNPAR